MFDVAEIRTIACTVIRALIPHHRCVRRAVTHLVVAIALVRVLDSGETEPLVLAEGHAHRTRHIGTRSRRADESAAIRVLCYATNLGPVG